MLSVLACLSGRRRTDLTEVDFFFTMIVRFTLLSGEITAILILAQDGC
jgi:hypothetical protein